MPKPTPTHDSPEAGGHYDITFMPIHGPEARHSGPNVSAGKRDSHPLDDVLAHFRDESNAFENVRNVVDAALLADLQRGSGVLKI